jgi:exopolysaccharide biosynthesis operon protein EpsL
MAHWIDTQHLIATARHSLDSGHVQGTTGDRRRLREDESGRRPGRLSQMRWPAWMMTSGGRILTVVSCCALLQPPPAWADPGDVINLSAGVSVLSDDNLFRLPPSADPQSDTITTTTLGLNLDKAIGLQRVIANVKVIDYRYRRNDYLDFTALNYDAKWLWAAGTRWTGELAFQRSQLPNDYANDRNLDRRNVQIYLLNRFEANYWFHSSWAAVAGVLSTSLENQVRTSVDGDYEADGYNFGLRYLGAAGNSLTARVVHLEGDYSKRPFNSVFQFDNGFTQDNYQLDFSWRLSGLSQLRGRIEYLDREYQHFPQRDYSGLAGNLQYTYAISGKSTLTLAYVRALEAYQQLTTSYYVLDDVALSAQWLATGKITVNALLGYARQDYRGAIIPLPAGVAKREDDTTRLGFDVAYQAAPWIQFKAGVTLQRRNSNYEIYEYRDRTAFVSATLQY